MLLVKTVAELDRILIPYRSSKSRIGFVPTLGALHEGHLTLIDESRKVAGVTICSIFVNPTQFNDKKDLDKYPRTLEKDSEMLESRGTDILFFPSVEEVYPGGMETKLDVDLNGLDKFMEGKFRPGHFEGVVQVVHRLLDMVSPTDLFMGQKDFQQSAIIAQMIRDLKLPVLLKICPTIREESGLALSSRNTRLSREGRNQAATIYNVLMSIFKRKYIRSVDQLTQYGQKKLNQDPFKLEYLEIVNGHTLQLVKTINPNSYTVVCVATWLEGVRLIDNIILTKEKK